MTVCALGVPHQTRGISFFPPFCWERFLTSTRRKKGYFVFPFSTGRSFTIVHFINVLWLPLFSQKSLAYSAFSFCSGRVFSELEVIFPLSYSGPGFSGGMFPDVGWSIYSLLSDESSSPLFQTVSIVLPPSVEWSFALFIVFGLGLRPDLVSPLVVVLSRQSPFGFVLVPSGPVPWGAFRVQPLLTIVLAWYLRMAFQALEGLLSSLVSLAKLNFLICRTTFLHTFTSASCVSVLQASVFTPLCLG